MSRRWSAFVQLLLARLREFYREPEALFWVYGFPIMLTIGLGIAFASKEPEPPEVDVLTNAGATVAELTADFLREHNFKVTLSTLDEAKERLANAKTALAIKPNGASAEYWFDRTRSDSVLAYRWVDSLLVRKANPQIPDANIIAFEEPGNRYIDFLVPGLMGMNLMGGGLWGVGFVIVDMRIRKLLKRMLATPMRPSDFLMAIITARLVFLLPDMIILMSVGWLVFGVPIAGNPLLLLFVILVGAIAFSGIGLLVASRAEKTETVSGLMNLVMLPMWLLSGTFFSSDRFPEVMQPFIQALPLTQLNNALRAVMLHNASLWEIAPSLGILALWAVVTFTIALRIFRWR